MTGSTAGQPGIPDRIQAARRRIMLAGLAGTCVPGIVLAAPRASAPDEALLAAAIASSHRTPADRARDGARHPLETLLFFGIAPDMKVIEVAPGMGWYTDILAAYLYRRGRLYAAHYARDDTSDYRRGGRARFDAKLAASPRTYDRMVTGVQPDATHGFRGIAPRGGADAVLTFRNLHNWMAGGFLDQSLRAFHDVLAPRGVLGVVEHRAAPGTSVAQMISSGYMTEEFVIARARAAGFELEARSEVNANPKDTRNHPHGVWSLPPTLRGKDAGRETFLAIGESDRMTLRFRRT